MTEHIKATSQAHGLRYPFDEKPQLGEPIEVADGVFWVRMDLPYTLDHINVWLLRDGDGWVIIDYKTGKERPHHFTQITYYAELLEEMTQEKSKCYLVYIGKKTVVKTIV